MLLHATFILESCKKKRNNNKTKAHYTILSTISGNLIYVKYICIKNVEAISLYLLVANTFLYLLKLLKPNSSARFLTDKNMKFQILTAAVNSD